MSVHQWEGQPQCSFLGSQRAISLQLPPHSAMQGTQMASSHMGSSETPRWVLTCRGTTKTLNVSRFWGSARIQSGVICSEVLGSVTRDVPTPLVLSSLSCLLSPPFRSLLSSFCLLPSCPFLPSPILSLSPWDQGLPALGLSSHCILAHALNTETTVPGKGRSMSDSLWVHVRV